MASDKWMKSLEEHYNNPALRNIRGDLHLIDSSGNKGKLLAKNVSPSEAWNQTKNGPQKQNTKAINMKSKLYAYAKSTEIQEHELVIINNSTEEIVSTFDFVPTDFPRKTIVNVEFVDTINNSSACYKNQNKKKHLTKLITLEKNSSLIIKSGSIKHSMDDLNLECGEHELNIYYFIDTPLIAKEESQPSRLELIKNSEILNI